MSGYNAAHGDTEAVRLSLDNERELSERYRAIIDNHVRWGGQSWNGIAKAAAGLHTYVKTVRTRTPEIADADLDAVQWTSIVALQIPRGKPGSRTRRRRRTGATMWRTAANPSPR
ncbi:Uncharacterised protein [Mycobacteroides abscessus subsp. abscessus]|uniref:hypothetical protein n=1 Tax=Mycobacteroides abscessus TaxID=36809 RepID=UPI000928A9C6|nr:hypothetical protein [Mycobacteroides abscessus]SIH35594.1 Uncharacterised protein [Mycobacteroides abscessus subsp. abscessus]